MASVVLDASAFLALLRNEAGADRVAAVLHDCLISAVNAAEIHTKLATWGMSRTAQAAALILVPATIVDFDGGLAQATGALVVATRKHGLSLGDRACLALAAREGLPALTADRTWAAVDVGVRIEVIR